MLDKSICIVIPTYKRPESLFHLLEALQRERLTWNHNFQSSPLILVVDNDPDMSAENVVRHFEEVRVIQEKSRGVSYVRNSGVKEALRLGADCICFVDDDEVITAGWLELLCAAAEEYNADLVGGPVVARFPDARPELLIKLGFFDRQRFETGQVVNEAWTGNLLVSAQTFKNLAPEDWFDVTLTKTGGEDAEFTRRMRLLGKKIVWQDEALIYEPVEPQRFDFKWHTKRFLRTGFVEAVLERRAGVSRQRLLVLGLLRIASGSSLLLWFLIQGNSAGVGHSVKRLYRGFGFLRSLATTELVQYG